MDFERTKIADLFSVAQKAGPYGELPAPPADFDPQIHVSRNEGVQPFFLTCERDSVVTTLSGEGQIEFRDTNVLHFRVAPGDFVYVPAGTPHRIRPEQPMVQFRYKALDPGREVVSWYCPDCNAELWRREFDASSEIPQRIYIEATEEFNRTEELRRCAKCSAVHPVVDVSGTRWAEIAAWLEAERADAPARTTNGDRLPPANGPRAAAHERVRDDADDDHAAAPPLSLPRPGSDAPRWRALPRQARSGVRALLPSQQRGGGHDLLWRAELARRGRRDVHPRKDARSPSAAARSERSRRLPRICDHAASTGRRPRAARVGDLPLLRVQQQAPPVRLLGRAPRPRPSRPRDRRTPRRRVRHVPHHVGQHRRHRLLQLRREGAHLHPMRPRQRIRSPPRAGVGRTTSTATTSSTRHDICSTSPQARPRRPRQPSEASAASPR